MNIVIKGLDKFEQKFGRSAVDKLMYETTDRAVKYVHRNLPPYPPASGKPFEWVSERQRRYVMAKIRSGEIEVPYKRTTSAGLAGSITTQVRTIGGNYAGVIGTNKIYAPWVISSEKVGSRGPQARYHQGTWWTLQEEVRKRFPDVVEIYRKAVRNFTGG